MAPCVFNLAVDAVEWSACTRGSASLIQQASIMPHESWLFDTTTASVRSLADLWPSGPCCTACGLLPLAGEHDLEISWGLPMAHAA